MRDGFPLVVEAASNDTSACAVSVDNPLVSYENFSSDNNSIAEIKPIEYISYCKGKEKIHGFKLQKEVQQVLGYLDIILLKEHQIDQELLKFFRCKKISRKYNGYLDQNYILVQI